MKPKYFARPEAKAGNRASTGVPGRKKPKQSQLLGFGGWWWNTEPNPRP
jgi:hypothetical protein